MLHRRDELPGPRGDLGVGRSQACSLPEREAEKGEGRAWERGWLQHDHSNFAKSLNSINRMHMLAPNLVLPPPSTQVLSCSSPTQNAGWPAVWERSEMPCPRRTSLLDGKAARCYLPCALSPLPALLCYEDFFQHFLIVDMLVLLMFPLLCRRPAYSPPL